MKYLGWTLRGLAALILLQTLFFKFTGAPESKFIFSSLGVEPYGRWFAGVSELIAAALLLYPATALFGALMGIGVMGGAILSHIFVLGVVVQDDGGLLFTLAWIVMLCCLGTVYLHKDELLKHKDELLKRLR